MATWASTDVVPLPATPSTGQGGPAPSAWAPVDSAPPPANPDVGGALPALEGQGMSAPSDRGILGALDDGVRMLTNKIPFADRFSAAMDTALGTGLPGADYAKNLQNEQFKDNWLTSQHPILAPTLGALGGAAGIAATAPEAAVTAPTLGARALASALTGAGYGAVQGASDTPNLTDTADAAAHIAKGAALGFGVGGALPVAAAGLGSAYSGAAGLVQGGAGDLGRSATKPLVAALMADGPQAVQAKLAKLGDQGMLADAGPAFLGKAQGASLNSDDARTILSNALSARAQGANSRIGSDIDAALGPAEDPQLVTNSVLATRSATDNANYPPALTNAPPVDTSGVAATVGQMLANSAPGTMTNKALTAMRNMLMEEREVPALDSAGNPLAGPDGQPLTETRLAPVDDAGRLHSIKMELDNVINYDAPGLGVPPGALANQQGAFKYIRGQLNDTLESQVPGYAQANAASSALANRADAVNLGTSILDSGKTAITPQNLQQQFDAMDPGAQIALAKGTRGEIDRILDTRANDLVAGKNVVKGEGDWNRARLATVFGDGPTSAVINTMDREGQFANTYNKVVENSQTAQRNAAAQAMRAPTSSNGHPLINPDSTMSGVGMTLGKNAVAALVKALSPNPTSSYGDIANVLTAQGAQRDAYLKALVAALDGRTANAATGQAIGNRSALAAALIGGPLANDRLQNQ